MRADSGEVLKGCAPERFLNEYLAFSLFISKPREAPEWISGEKKRRQPSASKKSAAACRHAAAPIHSGNDRSPSWGQLKAKRSK